ncbi:MAG: carboxypeptidase-like regulatory domain-containing protein, partial [Planctomycetes bacterium]|nr:carboxypeptidase-like regulatory domain-containing protein [Planctomycetota bacterium]
MRGRIALTALIIAFLLSISTWIALTSSDSAPPEAEESRSMAERNGVAAETASIATPDAEAGAAAASPALDAGAAAAEPAPSAGAEEIAGAKTKPAIAYRIQGEVLAGGGAPVGGAAVSVHPFRRLASASDVSDLFGTMAAPDDAEPADAAVASGFAGANGWFEIPLEGPGTYLVEATAPGYARAIEGPVRLSRRDPDTTLGLELREGCAIAGTVTDGNGSSLPGVPVFLYEKIYGERRALHPLRTVTDGGG